MVVHPDRQDAGEGRVRSVAVTGAAGDRQTVADDARRAGGVDACHAVGTERTPLVPPAADAGKGKENLDRFAGEQ